MKIKKLIIIVIAILSAGLAKSQIDGSTANQIEYQLQNYYKDFVYNKIGTESVMSYENIEGDPYLYRDFKKGTIKFKKEKNIVGKIRYNMYSDEIEFIHQDYHFVLIYEESFSGIKLGDYDFVQLPDPGKIDNAPGYFIYLTKGNYSLLVKKSVSFFEEEKPKIMVESKPRRFEKNADKFYLLNENNELYEINSVRKLKKYSDYLRKLKEEYTANNKLKVRTESLTNFVSWLNTK